jgi:aryl-phospho-beta-D-glucosidase BglC (GH1 family)
MFLSSCPDSDEIDAVTSLVLSRGLEATKSKWEAHWRNVLKEEGLEWFVNEVQYNSLRIPIGFFTLGPEWCVGTEFGSVKWVYGNSWEAVKEVVERVREWGIRCSDWFPCCV